MMKSIAVVVAVLVGALALYSAAHRGSEPEKQHRVVFELSSDEPQAWMKVLNHAEALQRALGPTSIEIVAHSGGLAMLTTAKSGAIRDRMQQDSEHGIAFAACENTMKRMMVTKQDLVPFAKTVDSGVAELVRKQEAGWSYLRIAP